MRHMSTQFHVTHKKMGKGSHKLTLSNPDSDHLATVTYDHQRAMGTDLPSLINVDYLKSHREGQGHGQVLMQHLYDRYPKSDIDWGSTIHPASTHMAEKFKDKYPNRTAYVPATEEYIEGTEGMYSGRPGD